MSKRRRVLVTTPDFPPAIGGIQRLLGKLVAHATGWEVLVVALRQPEGGFAPPAGAIARTTNKPPSRGASIARLNARTLRTGLVWRPEAVICGHIVTSPAALLLSTLLRVPSVQYVYAKELANWPRLSRLALERSQATIVLSQHAERLAHGAGAPRERVHVIPPGVDALERSPEQGGKDDRPTILTVARLVDRYKGFDVMLQAMLIVRDALPASRWVLIGEGPLRLELERSARLLGLQDSVTFCGRVGDAELDDWYARSHVFAMPSRVPPDGGGEGYGLVYLEAAARGLPCVGGKDGAVAEAVIDGKTGLLVDATNHVETAAALIELLADPERAEALGAAGRARARTLSWERMAASTETLLAALMASRR